MLAMQPADAGFYNMVFGEKINQMLRVVGRWVVVITDTLTV